MTRGECLKDVRTELSAALLDRTGQLRNCQETSIYEGMPSLIHVHLDVCVKRHLVKMAYCLMR